MNLFIVRPFGKKEVGLKSKATGNTETVLFDFDAVETDLIKPALEKLYINGGTTGEIFAPGDIRQDMFSQLLMADIVIADITIHNANVFYELGIRHALRNKKTILLKCPGFDDTPFDILGYRYVTYKKDAPAEAMPLLIKTLQETILENRTDSPVFNMLPQLQTQEPERFLAVPPDFGEEVEVAEKSKNKGMLSLLAAEVEGMPWQVPALRTLGEAQYMLNSHLQAQQTWEAILSRNKNDKEANDRLATIYQRLAEKEMEHNPALGWELLAKSDKAIKQLLDNYKMENNKLGEVFSLMGRNAKMKWIDNWKGGLVEERKKKALQSVYLKEAYEGYETGFTEDLNHFYSGINALGLLTVIISLAEKLPEVWEVEYNSAEEAATALEKYKKHQQKLGVLVEASVGAKRRQVEREGIVEAWLNMTEADLCCLTSSRPQRVGNLYQKVIQEASDLNFDAAKRQLIIYEQLEILPENVMAALEAFKSKKEVVENEACHFLLFTGHMIDKRDRKTPRFPPQNEAAVKGTIKTEVQKKLQKVSGNVIGIAGGACGGDILFHEVCEELGISTCLYLALPRELFVVESVQFAGPQWIERFDRLYKKLPHKILSNTKELPHWLRRKEDYTIWVRNNLWMLHSAFVGGGINMSLIAFWDGKGGDGAGGTEHMVKETKRKGGKVIIIPA